jgi:hypothetical protein
MQTALFLVAVHPGEGLLTEPTPAVRPWSRERIFMPHTGHCPELVGALGAEENGHSL